MVEHRYKIKNVENCRKYFVSACFTTSECAVPADRYLVMGEVNYWITAVPDGRGKKFKGEISIAARRGGSNSGQ